MEAHQYADAGEGRAQGQLGHLCGYQLEKGGGFMFNDNIIMLKEHLLRTTASKPSANSVNTGLCVDFAYNDFAALRDSLLDMRGTIKGYESTIARRGCYCRYGEGLTVDDNWLPQAE